MSRLRVAVFLLSSSILVCIGLVARQTIQQAVSPPSAPTLLSNALGSLQGGTLVSDATLTGSAHSIAGSDDEAGTVTYQALSSGAVRYDFSYPSGPRGEVHAANSAGPLGTWSGPDGVSHPVALHNLANRSDIFPAFTLLPLMSNPNLVITLVGTDTKNGKSVYHISVSQQFPKMPARSAPLAQHLSQTEILLSI
jgi:hypothetical protein